MKLHWSQQRSSCSPTCICSALPMRATPNGPRPLIEKEKGMEGEREQATQRERKGGSGRQREQQREREKEGVGDRVRNMEREKGREG